MLRMSVVDTSYCAFVGARLQESCRELAERWLERLVALLPVDANAVFTTDELLDHVPALIDEIGRYVAAADVSDIAASTVVEEQARALGQLRHRQQASVHQVLREFDLLGGVLEEFVAEATSRLSVAPPTQDCLEACRRVSRAVRVLMQITVATFVREYTETITAQADRLDQFNRAVSHELRNVLGTLQFGAALLANGSADDVPKRRGIASTLQRNTDRALQIVHSLERLPRSGIVPSDTPSHQIIDLGELVIEVFRQLEDMATARGVTLRCDRELLELYTDTSSLELVLMNLIANAIKYSDMAKSDRFVEVAGAVRGDCYEISVRDNGIGIPSHAIDGVFERFHRAHPELDAVLGVEGTGLGLAIVDECVKALRGEVRVESTDGVGSTFVVTLPKKLPVISELRAGSVPGQSDRK